MIQLLLEQEKDEVARENFQKINQFLNTETLLKGQFKSREFIFTTTVSNLRIKHHLGLKPNFLIQGWLEGQGTVTWNYALITDEELDVTIGGTVSATNVTKVRVLLGRIN